MASWRISGSRALLTAGVALTAVAAATFPAQAAHAPGGVDDWGTVVDTTDCVQADAWVVRVKGLGKIIDAKLFQSHYPITPQAPKQHAGGKELVNLAPKGIGLGKVSALYSRAMGHAHPASTSGGSDVPARGEVYADAGGAAVDIGLPYIQNPTGGTQLSPFGVHVEGISVSAYSQPGKPVSFTGGAARGYISVAGARIIDIPPIWAVNLGVRIPEDYTQAPLALATTNEQVTTDIKGNPTKGPNGAYKYDPKSTSGYVNGIHASVLGTDVADVTVAHAAVLRDPAITDKFAVKAPAPTGQRAGSDRAAVPGLPENKSCAPFAPPGAAAAGMRDVSSCW
ncbi:hypothetical protein [Streptomyces indicus]|uniref:Uncharacterized protein n=1 Tax=Streptomyces indicus TaxID=417292 RepID=A0A1G9CNE9_9ACTN|nr:hypothetical protein [Streptomyces indicus]SDK53106.1 hypothetical protein SAMN05421806_108221 [Streptomyces indicus]